VLRTVVHKDGSIAMTGALDMGSQNITNPGTGHDAFSDFVADEHVAHGGVTLTAGLGLAGGGTIAASRSFSLDLSELTEDATPTGSADYLAYTDTGEGADNKILIDDFVASEVPLVYALDWDMGSLYPSSEAGGLPAGIDGPASVASHPTTATIKVAAFDDTADEGRHRSLYVPADTATIRIRLTSYAETCSSCSTGARMCAAFYPLSSATWQTAMPREKP